MSEEKFPDLMTPAEIAKLFRVDPKTVTRWAKAGKLSAIRTLGGHRRYRESEVRALLDRPEPESEQFRVRYWATGAVGRLPAVHGGYEGRRAADKALASAVADGFDRPWMERWDAAAGAWERVADAS